MAPHVLPCCLGLQLLATIGGWFCLTEPQTRSTRLAVTSCGPPGEYKVAPIYTIVNRHTLRHVPIVGDRTMMDALLSINPLGYLVGYLDEESSGGERESQSLRHCRAGGNA